MKTIRYIPLIIFLIGIYWAAKLSIIGTSLTGDINPSVLIIDLFTVTGYSVWLSWLIIFINNKFRTLNIVLWCFSIIYHILFIIALFPFSILFFYLWPVIITIISLVMLTYESSKLIVHKTDLNKVNSLKI